MLVNCENQTPSMMRFLPEEFLIGGKKSTKTDLLEANKANKKDKTLLLVSSIGNSTMKKYKIGVQKTIGISK